MLISYKWLQSYFNDKLPLPEKLAECVTFSFAEVEGIEKRGDDAILDLKVLPDRACYALSHRGVAYEVAAIMGLKKKKVKYPQPEVKKVRSLEVRVEAQELCNRYMARVVENVTQKEMLWVKEHLDAMGQRCINPVVDGANLVMFDRGQPLHAFDADKVKGALVVRRAKQGEQMTTLDNRIVTLDESVLLIADDEGPLGIAGIKGGTRAAVTAETRNLILESASFNASHIRKTSERLGIKTDASKRFENKFSASLADKGMSDFSAYLFEMDRAASFGEITDIYSNVPQNIGIDISVDYISKKLGVDVSPKQVEEIFERLLIVVEKEGSTWKLIPPLFRVDLVTPEDVVEEVGRIIGYDKIPATLPPGATESVHTPKEFYYEWKIREILTNAGFSEVMTSSFSENGDIAIEKPLAEDKKYVRADLRSNFSKALDMNFLRAPLFGMNEIKIFEIGNTFTKEGERTSIVIGFRSMDEKKIHKHLKEITDTLFAETRLDFSWQDHGRIFEGHLGYLPEVSHRDISISDGFKSDFKSFSVFPFVVRDVALFVSSDTTAESVGKVIRENAGSLVIRGPELFDEFSKGGKKSLAFRLVFQSADRTLTDEEVNGSMQKVYTTLKFKGWTVR